MCPQSICSISILSLINDDNPCFCLFIALSLRKKFYDGVNFHVLIEINAIMI